MKMDQGLDKGSEAVYDSAHTATAVAGQGECMTRDATDATYTTEDGTFGLDGVSIGERLRQEREKKGWSARMLGQRSGVSHAYISHLEAGQYARPGIERLGRLAEALGVPLSALTGYTEEDPALEQIQVNLTAIRQLDPEALDRLAEIILAVKEKTEREHGRARGWG